MKRTYIALLSIVPGLLLASLALVTHFRLLENIDLQTTLFLQSLLPRSVDLPFSILSLAGSFEITTALLLLLVLAFYPPREGILACAAFLLILLVEYAGKTFIHQPGPSHALYRSVKFFPIPTGEVETLYAFPSGHAARFVFLCIMAIGLVRQSHLKVTGRTLVVGLIVAAELLMLVSRVYLGEHWIADVVGGTLLGAWLALPARAPLTLHPSLAQIRVRLRSLTE